jgi:hypothetical protein
MAFTKVVEHNILWHKSKQISSALLSKTGKKYDFPKKVNKPLKDLNSSIAGCHLSERLLA